MKLFLDQEQEKPADLSEERLQKMSDAELLRAMLLGTGHEPVLERVVPQEAYGPLLQFVRSLNGLAEEQGEPNRKSNIE